jgi:MFS family permease
MAEETLPPPTANRSAGRPAALPGRNLALALATLGFAVNFWAWSPVGGWLSDRVSGIKVLQWALGVVAAGAVVTAFQPHIVLATVAFLAMAAALGLGNGAVFALVGTGVPAASVGSVTGLVGAAGGLGGFLPPIVMGLVYQATGDYAIGLMLLSDVALAGLVFTAWRLGMEPATTQPAGPADPVRYGGPAGLASSTSRQPEDESSRDRASEVDRWDDEGGHDRVS